MGEQNLRGKDDDPKINGKLTYSARTITTKNLKTLLQASQWQWQWYCSRVGKGLDLGEQNLRGEDNNKKKLGNSLATGAMATMLIL